MTTAIHRMVDACREGRDPAVITRMNSGWAVMGQKQMLRGYSLLLPDPVVPHLNALPAAARGFDVITDAPLRDAIREKLLALQASSDAARSDGRIHHLDLSVRDLVASTAFYDRWLPRMGFQRIADCAEGPLWRGSQLELGLQRARTSTAHDRYAPGLHHLAFTADSREAVIELHESMRISGVNILDAPAEYPNYAPGYFAMFFADPDGLKLEYVFTP